MKTIVTGMLVLVASTALAQPAPAPAANSLSSYLKTASTNIQNNIAKSADKLTEADYGFRPAGVAADVRSFGQLLGHVANSNYFFCSRAKGEASPSKGDIEKTATTKADLVKALTESFAYCDGVYGGMTEAAVLEMISVPGPNNTTRQITRAQLLIGNLAHNNEHYGNLVTYLRAKGQVPPSSERGPQ